MTILTIQSKADVENKNVLQRRHLYAKRARTIIWSAAALSAAAAIVLLIVVRFAL